MKHHQQMSHREPAIGHGDTRTNPPGSPCRTSCYSDALREVSGAKYGAKKTTSVPKLSRG
jgi:hypothetical protein